MKVEKAIEKRRSYRGLESVEITDDMIEKLVWSASLAPSCYNNQPWKFIFVRSKDKLEQMKKAISKGNEWMYDASCLIAVLSKKELDCVVKNREYYLFDTGLGVGQLMLMATEMGLATHAVAGFSPKTTAEILSVPEGWDIITIIAVGQKSKKKNTVGDLSRPDRLAYKYVYSVDEYSKKLNKKVKH